MLVLEVKTSQDQPRSPSEVARKVVAVIGEEGFLEDCILASFEREVIEEAKRRAPRLKTALIFGQDHADDVFEGSWDVLSVYHKVVDEPFLRRGREGRKKVFVWTVNDPETMKRLAALGIDGVISDDPLSLDAVLGRR